MKWENPFKSIAVCSILAICILAGSPHNMKAGSITNENGGQVKNIPYLKVDDSIKAMLKHPLLSSFATHMLPQPEDAEKNLSFRDIGRLMPWHGHVHPQTVVNSVNRLIADSARNLQVFYSFSEAQSASHTGLFFFRGRPGAPFALICPGGGFRYIGALHEGFPLAVVLNQYGFNAFVLQYRTGGERIACEDLALAVSWIFRHAGELQVSTKGYSVWGGSAGARMAANLGSYGPRELGGAALPKPCCVIMAYTGHNRLTENEPPTFAVVSEDDPIASARVMEARINALKKQGTEAEILIFHNAGHGFGTGEGTDADGWMKAAIGFWEKQLRKLGITME